MERGADHVSTDVSREDSLGRWRSLSPSKRTGILTVSIKVQIA